MGAEIDGGRADIGSHRSQWIGVLQRKFGTVNNFRKSSGSPARASSIGHSGAEQWRSTCAKVSTADPAGVSSRAEIDVIRKFIGTIGVNLIARRESAPPRVSLIARPVPRPAKTTIGGQPICRPTFRKVSEKR
ncbi:hypothetical protein ACN263_17340 [Micromonospora sp. WMMD729]|uniref:hypothetical protein n=1 Tax=Micromonospora sp. WMMD729 TaxID=3404127 RepID=UPI003BF609EC